MFHTAANASHVRVALKNDNLGLGAQRSTGQNEGTCTGLDAFQGLLGRLNGKSETELEQEQNSHDDLKRAIYTERRWGSTRFVSGGLLIGDRIAELKDQTTEKNNISDIGASGEDSSRNKKRRRTKEAQAQEVVNTDQLDLGSPSRSLDLQAEVAALEETSILVIAPQSDPHIAVSESAQRHAEKAQRKLEKIQARQARQGDRQDPKSVAISDVVKFRAKEDDKTRKKANKVQRKLAKRSLRENRSSSMTGGRSKISLEGLHSLVDDAEVAVVEGPLYNSITPISASGGFTGGRHAVRQRYIQHKRMAMMNSTALNEVRQAGVPYLIPPKVS